MQALIEDHSGHVSEKLEEGCIVIFENEEHNQIVN